jgi:hypothetical protein
MAQEQRNEVMLCERVVRCWDGVWEVYRRLVEDWRRYDAMLWEIPFGTMAAVGAILTLAFHYIPSSEHVVKAILFIALAWFTLVMMHLSYKVRHFQIERAACIEAIEHLCTGFAIPYETERAYRFVLRAEIGRNPLGPLEHGFYRVRSYHLIYAMYIGMIYMLFYLAFIELSPYICLNGICLLCLNLLICLPVIRELLAAIYAAVATIVLLTIVISIGSLSINEEERR